MYNIMCFSLYLLLGTIVALSTAQENRIVGGNFTTIEQYPYMANMQLQLYGITWSQHCGATLITSRTVVSNAHCYVHYSDIETPSEIWRVRLGSSYSNRGGSLHGVSGFIIHENFNQPSRLNNDVAIVRLSNPAVFSDTVRVAHIAGSNYDLPDGTPVVATGWGGWAFRYHPSRPEQLQDVNLNTINQNVCVQRYALLKAQPGNEDFPDVTPSMVCAGILNVGGHDTCQGDAGGPLIHNNIDAGHVIMGITSWRYGCGHLYYPGVYVRVSAHANWIVRNGSV